MSTFKNIGKDKDKVPAGHILACQMIQDVRACVRPKSLGRTHQTSQKLMIWILILIAQSMGMGHSSLQGVES